MRVVSSETVDERSSPVLRLYEVLEDEYRVLHGLLPQKYLDCKNLYVREGEPIGEREAARLVECMYACLHERARVERKPRAALCLSGGGIRSGAFSLGILQGLARYGLLDRFDYLSTVSGGGYIGSWLTAWIHREGSLRRVIEALKRDDTKRGDPEDAGGAGAVRAIDPEPEPIRHLRAYSNFLTPRTGLLSADAWTFGAIYLRNLLINWTVLIPLLLAVLCVPRLAASGISTVPPVWLQIIVLIVGVVAGATGIAYIGLNQPSVYDAVKDAARGVAAGVATPRAKGQGSFLFLCLFPLMLCALCLTSYWAWHTNPYVVLENRPEYLLARWVAVDRTNSLHVFVGLCIVGASVNLLGWVIHSQLRHRFGLSTLLTALISILTGCAGGALVFAATRVFGFLGNPHAGDNKLLYACFAFPLFLVLFLLAIAFIAAITSRDYWRLAVKDEDREWWSRCSGWLLIATLAWTLFGATVIFGASLLIQAAYAYVILPLGVGSGLLTLLGGRSAATPATAGQRQQSWKTFLMQHAVALAAPVFLLFFIIVLALTTDLLLAKVLYALTKFGIAANPFATHQPSLLTDAVSVLLAKDGRTHLDVVRETPLWLSLSLMLVLLCVGLFAAKFIINLNKFSLHYAYRNRLVRAFLGASRRKADRNPNPFTGFDTADNVYMHELRPGLLSVDNFTKTKKAFIEKLLRENSRAAIANNAAAPATPPAAAAETIMEKVASLVRSAPEAPPNVSDQTIYEYIYGNLSQGTRDALGEYAGKAQPREPTQSLLVELVTDLNKILESRLFDSRYGNRNGATAQPARLTLDNRVTLEAAFPDEVEHYDSPPPPHKLMHVINTSLNLVAGDNLAWQQRRAAPFSISPLHSGNYKLGYRATSVYGGTEGITLGTAATISGAAANPNMGYNSSPLVTFILTLFNVRLGWWLGNTSAAGADVYRYSHPQLSIAPVIAEAFGLTDDKSRYINLSDGGHFENLGLYEMVLRRCHFIVVVDGSQDADCHLDDLGNAVRKIRVDLGIPITFDDPVEIYSRKQKRKGKYCAVAKIDYASVDGGGVEPGKLIYIKTAFYGDEPPDIFNYAQQHEAFPHEGTIDQFYDESQFESYRMLGSHVMSVIHGDLTQRAVGTNRPASVSSPPQLKSRTAAESSAANNNGTNAGDLNSFYDKVEVYIRGKQTEATAAKPHDAPQQPSG